MCFFLDDLHSTFQADALFSDLPSAPTASMTSGWAQRRNGTCGPQQTECGQTVAPFHVCCPGGSSCPAQYNVACCQSKDNCTAALVANPHCANPGWDLYDNGGFFCCLAGHTGYATPDNTDGCAEPGYQFKSGEQLLKLVSAGQRKSVPPLDL